MKLSDTSIAHLANLEDAQRKLRAEIDDAQRKFDLKMATLERENADLQIRINEANFWCGQITGTAAAVNANGAGQASSPASAASRQSIGDSNGQQRRPKRNLLNTVLDIIRENPGTLSCKSIAVNYQIRRVTVDEIVKTAVREGRVSEKNNMLTWVPVEPLIEDGQAAAGANGIWPGGDNGGGGGSTQVTLAADHTPDPMPPGTLVTPELVARLLAENGPMTIQQLEQHGASAAMVYQAEELHLIDRAQAADPVNDMFQARSLEPARSRTPHELFDSNAV